MVGQSNKKSPGNKSMQDTKKSPGKQKKTPQKQNSNSPKKIEKLQGFIEENLKNSNNNDLVKFLNSANISYFKTKKMQTPEVYWTYMSKKYCESVIKGVVNGFSDCQQEVRDEIWFENIQGWVQNLFNQKKQKGQDFIIGSIKEQLQIKISQMQKKDQDKKEQLIKLLETVGGKVQKLSKKQQQQLEENGVKNSKRKQQDKNQEIEQEEEKQIKKKNGSGKNVKQEKQQEKEKKSTSTKIKNKSGKITEKLNIQVQKINNLYGFDINDDENEDEENDDSFDEKECDEEEEDDDLQENQEEEEEEDNQEDLQEKQIENDDNQEYEIAQNEDEENQEEEDEDGDVDNNLMQNSILDEINEADFAGMSQEEIEQLLKERDNEWAVNIINDLDIENMDELQLYKYDVDIEGMVFDDVIKNKKNKEILDQILSQLPKYLHMDEDQKKQYFKELNTRYKKDIKEEKGKLEHTHSKKVKFNVLDIQVQEFDKEQDTKSLKKTPIKFPNQRSNNRNQIQQEEKNSKQDKKQNGQKVKKGKK